MVSSVLLRYYAIGVNINVMVTLIFAQGIHKASWTTVFLQIDVGGTIEENAWLAPRTANILKDIPGVYTAFSLF